MNERDNPSKDESPIFDQLREEVAGGLRYTHTRANANTRKLLEIASFAYAGIDLLAEKGLIQIEELDERKKTIAGRLVEKFIADGMGITHVGDLWDVAGKFGLREASRVRPGAPPRHAPGVLHHMMARALDRQLLFREDHDREDFVR
jgi:hypothetical protein